MTQLAQKSCEPCKGDIPPLKSEKLKQFQKQIHAGWQVIQEHHLEKEFSFKDFKSALVFTNKVGEIAEHEGHHPDIYLSWGKVKLTLWTHKINGLTESDFILAAKVDAISNYRDTQK
ncbi:MAG: 4a-hydroxytetrahydrobiopterin dehydratase [Deltaproteobacteria bacterium RIFCSPHIGHO2_02_FULL_40_11]|nr:MAG: 4a-hydroxytetrahydrobiopterin dehydratase [Deltaproteobacteria bacterium RIFCSPHIGHO2_02_FULL_40_11]